MNCLLVLRHPMNKSEWQGFTQPNTTCAKSEQLGYVCLLNDMNVMIYIIFTSSSKTPYFSALSIKKREQNFQVPYFQIPYKSIFGVIFPILNSLFYHHGNQSAISVVRIFKNKTLSRKPSNIQKSPFSSWSMEIGFVSQGKNTLIPPTQVIKA